MIRNVCINIKFIKIKYQAKLCYAVLRHPMLPYVMLCYATGGNINQMMQRAMQSEQYQYR